MYQEDGPGAQKTVRRLLDVFKRHKILVLLPIVIALEVSVPLALKQPHHYVSDVRLFFDTSAPNPSSLDPSQHLDQSPAQAGDSLLKQLISTRSFLVDVGKAGPLAARLKAQGVPDAKLDDKIVATLAPAFGTTVVGDQLVQVSMTGKDAGI